MCKDISKRDSTLAMSELEMSGVPSNVGKVGSLLHSWDRVYNANGIKRVASMSPITWTMLLP